MFIDTDKTVIDLCAGPGGWDVGAALLGLPEMAGVDLSADACATGRAAGWERHQGDIRTLDPADYPHVTGLIGSTPCPSYSRGGKGAGARDMQTVIDAITCLGIGCRCIWPNLPHHVEDIRSALIVEVMRWAMLAPSLQWFAAEQVPGAEDIWYDVAAELAAAGWESFDVVEIDAADYGVASRRVRSFIIARKYSGMTDGVHPARPLPPVSMAAALGWAPGTRVFTRGDRKTSGGNAFSADGPSWCLTRTARSWKIGAPDGPEMTPADGGLLNGFRRDYPWQGSRTSQFMQVADVVSPVVAAVVLGTVTNTPWEDTVRAYVEELYGHAREWALVVEEKPLTPRRTVVSAWADTLF